MGANAGIQVSEGVTKAHLAQTPHSEKTAHEKYLAENGTLDDRIELLNIYADCSAEEQLDELNIPEVISPDEVEVVESDFEDHAESSTSLATCSTSSPARSTPVTRFNLIRDSVQPFISATSANNQFPTMMLTTSKAPAPSSSRKDSLDMPVTTRDPTPVKKN